MPSFSNIDGEESATVTFTVSAVSLTRNSSAELQEILCIGDPDVASSLGVARVTNAAPASTNAGLNVRVLSGPSSVADFSVRAVLPSTYGDHGLRVLQSTAGDLNVTVAGYSTTVNVSSLAGPVIVRSSAADQLITGYQSTYTDFNVLSRLADRDASTQVANITNTTPASTAYGLVVRDAGGSTIMTVSTGSVRVHQSTAADLNVTVAGYSTTVNVSSLAGPVIVRSSAADAIVTVKNSTIAELLASVQQNSTVWQVQAKIQDSSAVGFIGTTTRPTTGAQGLIVRPVLNDLLSTCFSTIGNGSTSATVVSSAASVRHKVYAYSITSTAQAVNTLSFASSLANPLWHIQMQAQSSAISGANLAVSPPAWLFATEAASPLVFKVSGTTGSYHLSFSYFSEA